MELQKYLATAQPDIVLLQETWLTKDSMVSFPGYAVIRKDRPPDYGAQAGGVATLVCKDAGIKYDKIDEDITPNDRCTDVLLVKIVWRGHTFILTNIYSPPHSSRPTKLPGFTADYTLAACLNLCPNQIFAEDLNAHSSIWDSREAILPNKDGEEME